MKNTGWVILGMLTGIALTVAFLVNSASGQVKAEVNPTSAVSTPTLADEG